MTIFEKSHSNL